MSREFESWPTDVPPLAAETEARMLQAMVQAARAGATPPAPSLWARVCRWFLTPLVHQRVALAGVVLLTLCTVGILWWRAPSVPPLGSWYLGMTSVPQLGPGAPDARSAGPARLLVHPDDPLRIELRPEESVVGGAVDIDAFVDAAPWQGWPVQFQRQEDGTFLINAPVRSLPNLRAGSNPVVFILARQGQLPPREEVLAQLRSNRLQEQGAWRVLRGVIEVQTEEQP